MTEQTEAGPVLGEEAVLVALRAYDKRQGYSRLERMRDAIDTLAPHVAALVAAARAAGEQAERERCAEELRALIEHIGAPIVIDRDRILAVADHWSAA